jgi:hypothetical protein
MIGSITADGVSFMVSSSKLFSTVILLVLFVSCGQTGGQAPGLGSIGAVTSCAGSLVGGSCWYYGSTSDSCTTVCSIHGGYNSATQAYAGSGGSDLNCTAVMNALGVNPGSIEDSSLCAAAEGSGCTFDHLNLVRTRCTGSPTDADSSYGQFGRICACNE